MGIKNGIFITFEGIEGSGKSTHIKLLYSFLKKNISEKVFLTREPGGTKISEKIRSLVINDLNEKSNPLTELFLLFAARAEHFDLIKKKLKDGYIVLCDRYIDSTIAYQHYTGKIKLKYINYLQLFIDKGQKPNFTILIDLHPSIGKKRIAQRKKKLDRFDSESVKKMILIRNAFLKIYKNNIKRVFLVSNNLSKNEVQNKIRTIVLKRINK
jgi:dTMP kinase